MDKTKSTGTVAGYPIITTIKGGVEVGNLFVDIPDVGRAKIFFDDPHDEVMFSFQDGDEVSVEWWKKGEWLNANVLTPSGSADPAEQLERALKIQSGDGLLDKLAELVVACRRAIILAGIEETIDSVVTADAAEESIRTSANSIFIEINRRGVDLDALLG